MWAFRAYRGNISELYEQKYETIPQSSGSYEGAVIFMKLLSNDKKDKIHNALKHIADILHKNINMINLSSLIVWPILKLKLL